MRLAPFLGFCEFALNCNSVHYNTSNKWTVEQILHLFYGPYEIFFDHSGSLYFL